MQWINSAFPDLRFISPLSQGGQKWVYSAEHLVDGMVVLKIIQPNQSPESVKREILAVQKVQSNRVPKILDAGQVNSPMGICVWLREQRIIGRCLRDRLKNSPLSALEVFKLTFQMLEALRAVEEAKIVHRDVKPDNIMIDPVGNFFLLDFGIARHLTMSPLTTPSSPFGKFTLGYAPPEQFRNLQKDIDGRADLFALGVTIFECATGINPFINGSSNALEIIRRVENEQLPPLKLSCKANQSFADLVSALTQKRRDHRPPSVGDAFEWMVEILKEEGFSL